MAKQALDKSIEEKQWDPDSIYYRRNQAARVDVDSRVSAEDDSFHEELVDQLNRDSAISAKVSEAEGLVGLDFAKEKGSRVNKIKESLKLGLECFEVGNFKEAEKELVKVIKPVSSKSSMKDLYVKIEDVKEQALGAMYHLGLIYLNDDSYFNHHAKATGIFQYCGAFAKKYHVGDAEFYLNKAHEVEVAFLKSINVAISEPTNSRENIESYKEQLETFRDEIKAKIISIKDLKIDKIGERADIVEEIYNDCCNFFVNDAKSRNNKPDESQDGLLQKLLADCYKQLGNPPEYSEHAIIALGSLALGTMTPWSDLEFAILINKPEYKEYFRNLTKLLQIKVINLGETHLKGLGVEALNNFRTGQEQDEWFWDDVIKIKFNFDSARWDACKVPLGRQGNHKVTETVKSKETGIEESITVIKPDYELILTPDEMAAFQKEMSVKRQEAREYEERKGRTPNGENKDVILGKKAEATVSTAAAAKTGAATLEVTASPAVAATVWFESDKHLVQALRSVSLIEGSQALLDEYRSKVAQAEKSEVLQKRALLILKENIDQFSLKLGDEEEGRLIDSKMHIYRLGDRVINGLSNYCNLTAKVGAPKLTVWQMIEKLKQEGIVSIDGGQRLKEALAIATELRLNAYSHNDTRSESVSTYVPAVEHLNEVDRHRLIEETFHMDKNGIKSLYYFYYVMLRVQTVVKIFYNDPSSALLKILLGKDNLFVNDNYNKGMVHARFLEYDKALQCLEKAKNEKPENLKLLENLFFLYIKIGIIEGASALAQEMLKLEQNEHQDDLNHPDIAASYNNLGTAYQVQGEYDKAVENHQKALKINLIIYESSPNHSDIATSYGNLGNACLSTGEYGQAIGNYDQALKIRLKAYESSPNHPDIATSYSNLGNAYRAQEEYGQAIENYDQALKIRLKVYESNPSHPDIAISYGNLGVACQAQGEYGQAIENHKQALKIRLKAYESSPNHPDIAASYNNLGVAYQGQGEHDKAIENHQKALVIRLKACKSNSNHYFLIDNYNSLGKSLRAKGKYDEALQKYQEALNILFTYPTDKLDYQCIAGIYHNFCNVHKDKKEYNEAFLYAKKIHDIHFRNQECINNAKNLYRDSLIKLGNLSLLASNENDAQEYYGRVNPNHKQMDLYSEEFINLQLQARDFSYESNDLLSALDFQEVLVKVDSKLRYGNHYHNLACFYAAQGNLERAKEAFIKALVHPNINEGLHTEYAQFLIKNKELVGFIVSSQEISDHLYAAVDSSNIGSLRCSLRYGKIEETMVCPLLCNRIKQKNGTIAVNSKALAYYLLLKHPQYTKKDDKSDLLLKSFTDYCENLQDEISFRLLSDAYSSLNYKELSEQYLAKAELIMHVNEILSSKHPLDENLEQDNSKALEPIKKYVTDLERSGQQMIINGYSDDGIERYCRIFQIYQSIITDEPEQLQIAKNNLATIALIADNSDLYANLKISGIELNLDLVISSSQDVAALLQKAEYIWEAMQKQVSDNANESFESKTSPEDDIVIHLGENMEKDNSDIT